MSEIHNNASGIICNISLGLWAATSTFATNSVIIGLASTLLFKLAQITAIKVTKGDDDDKKFANFLLGVTVFSSTLTVVGFFALIHSQSHASTLQLEEKHPIEVIAQNKRAVQSFKCMQTNINISFFTV